MPETWSRGDRDGSDRTPLPGGEPHGPAGDREPGPAGAPPAQSPGDARPAADQAADNQERMLETGEENPA